MEPQTRGHNTVISATPEKNVINVVTKKHKDKSYFRREDLNGANVIEGKRNRTEKHRFETK